MQQGYSVEKNFQGLAMALSIVRGISEGFYV